MKKENQTDVLDIDVVFSFLMTISHFVINVNESGIMGKSYRGLGSLQQDLLMRLKEKISDGK